jgi:hypothetical protein
MYPFEDHLYILFKSDLTVIVLIKYLTKLYLLIIDQILLEIDLHMYHHTWHLFSLSSEVTNNLITKQY